MRPLAPMTYAVWAGLLWVASNAWAQPSGGSVRLPPNLETHLGVATARLMAEHRQRQVPAFARVLDPSPLVALDGDLGVALLAAETSRADAARVETFQGTSNPNEVRSIVAKATAEAAKVTFLRERIGLGWGPGIARLSDRQREALVRALVRGEAALLRVDSSRNAGQSGARTVEINVGSEHVTGAVLGPARVGEAGLGSSGLIAKVTGPAAALLTVGLLENAGLDNGGPENGVEIPQTAVFHYLGVDWAYVLHIDGRFERRRLDGVAEKGGVFVTTGFLPGEMVVTKGALGLLGVELSQPRTR